MSRLYWGPVFGLTWKLPKALLTRKYQPGKIKITKTAKAINETLRECLGDNGRLTVSSFHYPHWGVKSDHYTVPYHEHGIVGAFTFETKDLRSGINGKPSLAKQWAEWPVSQQLKELPKFFQAPQIQPTPELVTKMDWLYGEKLREIYAKDVLPDYGGPVRYDLLWMTDTCLCGLDAHERFSEYMKNPNLFVLRYKIVQYDPKEKMVRIYTRQRSDHPYLELYGDAYRCKIIAFCKRYLVTPLLPFAGKRFCAQGAYASRSAAKPILQFIHKNSKAADMLGWDVTSMQSPEERLYTFLNAIEKDYFEIGD